MPYKKDSGFTLIEILIVVIVVAILAALALPQFTSTKERALGKEARANLKLIAAAEKIYRMEFSTYYPTSADPVTDKDTINTNLKLSLSETNWDYSITGGASVFTAYADRQGSGGNLDCQYSIAQNDADGEPDPNASCP